MKRLLTFALSAVLLAGCGGGSATPGTTSSAPQGTKVPVKFRIDVPPGSLSAHRRSGQYISPATTQLAIDVRLSGYSIPGFPTTVPLTPGSSDCTTTLLTTYCQFTISLAFNTYTAIITAEDANGTPLSNSQVQFSVLAGVTAVVPLTLSGIPASLQVAPGALAVHGPSPSGFTLYGTAPQNVVVAALDPDGNIIVGPGAPTFTANVVSGSGWNVGTPATTSPNLLPITPPGTNNAGATVQVTANYSDYTCQAPGAVCSTTFTIKNDVQTLYVANFGNNTVTEYQSPYTGGPSATIAGGVNEPIGLALDGAGNLFVANYGNATVTEYASGSGVPTTTITTGLDQPYRVLVDGSGNLFVANRGNNTVTVYAPPYTGAPTTISSGVSSPSALALNVAGNLLVANTNNSTVTEYAPPYTGAPLATISTGVAQPDGLVLDAAGNLFVANSVVGDPITAYAPPYTGAPTVIPDGSAPNALALDASGNLFAVNGFVVSLDVWAPPYTGTPVVNAGGGGSALVLDGAGNAIVANPGIQNILVFAPPYSALPAATITSVSSPYGLAITP